MLTYQQVKILSEYQRNIVEDGDVSSASLTQPRAIFSALCREATTQAFLRQPGLRHQSLYYVTGIRILKKSSLKGAVGEKEFIAEVPGSQIPMPMHVRRVDSVSNLDNNSDIKEMPDEIVFAVELLKVKCRVGSASEPHDMEDINYNWTYHSLDDQDLQLSTGLGNALDAAELRVPAGIVNEEKFDDAGWNSQFEDDDEGLGGF
jgi:hypothetical protein